MENEETDKKFTSVIKVDSLGSASIHSNDFVIDGSKWVFEVWTRVRGKGKSKTVSLSVYLWTTNSLSSEWRRRKYRLTFVNQLSEKLSQVEEPYRFSSGRMSVVSFNRAIIPLTKLIVTDGGVLVNREVKLVIELDVLEVAGELDDEEITQPHLKRIKRGNDCEYTDVNGFQVLPSQVESAKRVFERHPDIAIELRAKNNLMRTACMNVLLNLIGTLRQSHLSYDDLVGTDSALAYIKDNGFKVDWLEQKLGEVKAKKMEEKVGEVRKQRLEKELKELKQKCLDAEAQLKDSKQKYSDTKSLLEKEKAKLLATTRASPLKLDDII